MTPDLSFYSYYCQISCVTFWNNEWRVLLYVPSFYMTDCVLPLSLLNFAVSMIFGQDFSWNPLIFLVLHLLQCCSNL